MNLESKPNTWYSCMLTPRTEVPSELPSEQKLPSETRPGFFFWAAGLAIVGARFGSELEKPERDWKAMLLSFDFICFYI